MTLGNSLHFSGPQFPHFGGWLKGACQIHRVTFFPLNSANIGYAQNTRTAKEAQRRKDQLLFKKNQRIVEAGREYLEVHQIILSICVYLKIPHNKQKQKQKQKGKKGRKEEIQGNLAGFTQREAI